ncbi:penicillin-binding protein 1A [Leptothrix cholodnii]|nr:penicillin-binding protein 1A [Leptothrix cholodnii]
MNASKTAPSDSPARPPESWPRMILRIVAWVAGVGLAGAMAAALLLGVALATAYPNLPKIDSLIDYRPKLPMRIISAEGTLLGEFGEERRNYLSIREIPKVMQDAVLAIEDSRFYEHGGIDYRGALRAALGNLREARSQGASTITMQVARNFYLSTEKTLTRKIYEILLSLKIESQLSKQQILEVYMNQIYLGQRAYGFAAASEIYFGKPLKDITVAEAAMLAGLPKAPSAYNPISNRTRAEQRQRYIIERMRENGFISAEQHDQALAQPLKYHPARSNSSHAGYVAETARQLIFAQYGDDAYTRGLNVHLSVRAEDQAVAYRALRRAILDFERRKTYRGPEAYVDLPKDQQGIDTRAAEALEDHPDNDELRSAVVTQAAPKKVTALLQSGESISITGSGLRNVSTALSDKAPPKVQIRPGAVIRVSKDSRNEWSIGQLPEVEGAFVSLDPYTGEIRALVGGFDYAKNKFNHVTQAWRQPGSSFKPFIYSAALEKGIGPATVVDDAPLFFDADATGSQPWEPKNYDGQFEGPMSLRRGLAKSKNMVSIRVLEHVGPAFAQDWVSRFGFEPEKHPAYLTMALGAGTVTPMQMASAYSVFANGGHRVNPMLITRVTDNRGRILAQTQPVPLDDSMRVITARNAFMMDSLLQEITRSGTAARAQSTLKRPDLYGKTGTTNDSNDAWFAGFQPSLVAVVWVGYDQPRKLGDRETGGGLALPVWIEYMAQALRGVAVNEIAPPEGVTNVGGEWYYSENANGEGVSTLGIASHAPDAASAPTEERKSILDLFRN